MNYRGHIPRPVQTHTRSTEENADDGQYDKGHKDERDHEDDALFGVTLEGLDDLLV